MRRDLTLPIDEAAARKLRVGDILFLTGTIFTARDEAHLLMMEKQESGEGIPFDPSQMALFHCGPVVAKQDGGWRVIAAGPTTSIRMEIFEDKYLEMFRPPIIIGKGGMGDRTQAALKSVGAVYAHYTGGAGALAAKRIESVEGVEWLDELGMPEAAWFFKVKAFGPLLVTMDSAGGNLYKDLEPTIAENVKAIMARINAS
ncbi:MAG: fumarate hydratase [Candidatus Atribacteria bacterium]|nr:MAG: fumarate hydratase [Candidatus Atribacteria bacterium]